MSCLSILSIRLIVSVCLSKSNGPKRNESDGLQTTVNLPQSSLTVFGGDPQKWTEFWSNFEIAAVNQDLPDMMKLSYLLSCLKETISRATSEYNIAPETIMLLDNY